MSAWLGLVAMMAVRPSVEMTPIYDVPRVTGIRVDGDLSDGKGISNEGVIQSIWPLKH